MPAMNAKPTIHESSQPADDARKPRSDGEQSRERLLQAAMRLFGEQGFSKTSTREIAQAANANVAAISYYFGDKAGLYQACFTAICTPAEDNIAQFNQPHFTLREALHGFYRQMVAPLMAGDDADVLLRLFYREMLEPTGIWQREIETNIMPEHLALVAVLCRHLGLKKPTDSVHRLAYAIAAMCVQMMIGRDIIAQITPHMMATPEAIADWADHLTGFAEVLVKAEKTKLQQGKA
ncbi:DNA-binding transcriptional regulator, AcrR family [Duganella sacchari]|uniref:DNA-binding transcriptional regulator, AcrR family n=2 Tax=Telluria group TaxID=2895353 RepID=A0A1M7RCE3_9BURK|nr:DNA-binding transcriptional regulator, AcrR family [Duganella sacchari]